MKTFIALIAASALAVSAGLTAAPPQSTGLTPAEQKEGWKALFDGKTLNGWTSRAAQPGPARGNAPAPAATPAARWVVEGGEVVLVKNSGSGHLVTDQLYGDFTFRVDFWAELPATNSGVFLRMPETGVINSTVSYEINILDTHELWPTGSINNVQKTSGTPKTAGKWNTIEITARGDQVVVVLNGETVADGKSPRSPTGRIGLQATLDGASIVKFRNARIKTL